MCVGVYSTQPTGRRLGAERTFCYVHIVLRLRTTAEEWVPPPRTTRSDLRPDGRCTSTALIVPKAYRYGAYALPGAEYYYYYCFTARTTAMLVLLSLLSCCCWATPATRIWGIAPAMLPARR